MLFYKPQKRVTIPKVNSTMIEYVDETTLITTYNSFIFSHSTYFILSWGHGSKRILKLQFELLIKFLFMLTPILF